MNLYIIPGSCSLAPHIILHELGLKHNIIRVDKATKRTNDYKDYLQINPKGNVPALQLDDGRVITESIAILQYLVDTHSDKGLALQCGSFERVRLEEWLSYIAMELHRNYGPFFIPTTAEADKRAGVEKLTNRLQLAEKQLEKTAYIASDNFSVADTYLYAVLSWADRVSFSLDSFPAIQRYKKKWRKGLALSLPEKAKAWTDSEVSANLWKAASLAYCYIHLFLLQTAFAAVLRGWHSELL